MKIRAGWIHASKTRRPGSRALLILRSLGLMWAIAYFASAAIAQTRYQITRIPVASGANSVALGLNDKGEVVGYSFQGDDYQAFLFFYADKSMTEIGSVGGKLNAACAINSAGQVTGYSQDANGNLLAFLFSRNAPIASLGTLQGGSTSEAFGINNRGAVVGDSQSGGQNHRPVLFSNGSVQDLGLGGSNEPDALETAYAINDAGQIVGRHYAGNNAFHAFLFANGNMTDFGTLGGANGEALAINKEGQVVGDSEIADGSAHAFVMSRSRLKDLGTLPDYDNASYARGINNSGDIVGESDSADQKRAFLYTKGRLVELDKLAVNLSEAGFNSLDVAYGINDRGWIVGYGTTSDNLTEAFVAVPAGRGNLPLARGGRHGRRHVIQPQPEEVSEPSQVDYDVFYTQLLPDEGDWVEAGDYGYCFRPRVSEDWRPYRDGHWVWTDRGWYWESDEPYAWATYHYGRWVDIGGTGWCWVPGHQWAPAWVSWRESDQHVGWAPLPPEADISVNVGISSWSDSYYDIGPYAYNFISYSHWSEPSYARYIVPPERNVQIISETKNVTNIVTNNNLINNFGPPVQTVAAKTNQNIQPVALALTAATDPKAKYGQTLAGNQLKVVAPPPVLKPAAAQTPPVQNRIANPVVDKGWQGVNPADAAKLKKTIAQQNPPPKDLPKPAPLPTQQILKKGQVPGSAGPSGSPAPVISQKPMPPNLVRPAASPGAKVPTVKATPGVPRNAPPAGNKFLPPNLIGVRPTGSPGASPAVKPGGTPGGKPVPPTTSGSKQPPTAQKPSAPGTVAPGLPGNKPTPPSTPGPKQPPAADKPSPTGPAPGGPPNGPKPTPPNLVLPKGLATPKPAPASIPNATPQVKAPPQRPATQKPPPASTPQVKAPPAAASTPVPPPVSAPTPQPQVQAPAPKPQPQAKAPAPAPKPQPQAKAPAPAPKPQPQARPPAPKPQPQPQARPAPKPQPQPQAKPPAPKPQPQPQARPPAPKPQPQPQARPPAPKPQPQPQAKPPAPKPQPPQKQPPKGSPTPKE